MNAKKDDIPWQTPIIIVPFSASAFSPLLNPICPDLATFILEFHSKAICYVYSFGLFFVVGRNKKIAKCVIILGSVKRRVPVTPIMVRTAGNG